MVSDTFLDDQGRLCLKITGEGEAHPAKGKRTLKTRKTRTGVRQFPLPEGLMRLGFGEYVCRLAVQALLDNFRHRRVQAVEKVRKREAVLLHGLLMPAFDNREARAGQHARTLATERFINGSELSEVSYLRGASHVSSRGQEVILNHWS